MIVIGIMRYPTAARVAAPVRRFASGERTGRAEEVEVEDGCRAMEERTVLRAEKYVAEPTPVRRAEGRVPRQRERMGVGEWMMERMVVMRVAVAEPVGGACWMRVLRRSAGWRRTAERTPEAPPERKWDLVEGRGTATGRTEVEGGDRDVDVMVEEGAVEGIGHQWPGGRLHVYTPTCGGGGGVREGGRTAAHVGFAGGRNISFGLGKSRI